VWEHTVMKTPAAPSIPQPFINKLAAMRTGEKELALAIPIIMAAAESKDLKTLLKIHLKETQGHAKALEKIARELDFDLPTKGCPPMRKLITAGVKVVASRVFSSAHDQELIDVGRQIEKFEMDSYQPLCDTAESLGLDHALAVLTSILHQEQLAYELLGELAAGKGPIEKLATRASLRRGRATEIGQLRR
jgi:ferritin-like metal-binding protein YciE